MISFLQLIGLAATFTLASSAWHLLLAKRRFDVRLAASLLLQSETGDQHADAFFFPRLISGSTSQPCGSSSRGFSVSFSPQFPSSTLRTALPGPPSSRHTKS